MKLLYYLALALLIASCIAQTYRPGDTIKP